MQSGASGFVSSLAPPGCATLANALLFKFRWLSVEKGESLVSGELKRITRTVDPDTEVPDLALAGF